MPRRAKVIAAIYAVDDAGEPVDALTVTGRLRREGKLDAADCVAALDVLADTEPSSRNWQGEARRVSYRLPVEIRDELSVRTKRLEIDKTPLVACALMRLMDLSDDQLLGLDDLYEEHKSRARRTRKRHVRAGRRAKAEGDCGASDCAGRNAGVRYGR